MKHSLVLTGLPVAILETVYNIGCAGIRIADYLPGLNGAVWTVELELADSENPEEISALCQDWIDRYSLYSAGVIFNRNY